MTAGYPISRRVDRTSSTLAIGSVRGPGIPSPHARSKVRCLSLAMARAASRATAKATPSLSKWERQGRRAAIEPSLDGTTTVARCRFATVRTERA